MGGRRADIAQSGLTSIEGWLWAPGACERGPIALDRWSCTRRVAPPEPLNSQMIRATGGVSGRASSGRSLEVRSQSNRTSPPIRYTRYRGRRQSRRLGRAGTRMAGRPSPMISGAIAICSRSSRLASRNAETVTPPPSTNTRAQPCSSSNRSMSATAVPGSASAIPTRLALPTCASPGRTSGAAQQVHVGRKGR